MPITPAPAGTKPWYAGYSSLHDFVNALESELVAARQGESTLLTRLLLYASKEYVQSQITTGGTDVSELGNPLELIRINPAGDAFEGISQDEINPTAKGAFFWASQWI